MTANLFLELCAIVLQFFTFSSAPKNPHSRSRNQSSSLCGCAPPFDVDPPLGVRYNVVNNLLLSVETVRVAESIIGDS